jgi:hypothetical protein
MITPSFSIGASERVLPSFALNFTTASLDSRVTFTRTANTATHTNSSGVITAINANLPRFDYNPTTLVCNGLLIEETRTNILLNSLINGTSLSTQTVTTSAVAYTLSFYGTGSIVLSGTASATVAGTGAYPTRKTYTFTPTAGSLTLTVSGTVQYAQLETGSFATSFIPTDATVGGLTRNADLATVSGTNFSSWFNTSEGTFVSTINSAGQNAGAPWVLELTTSTNAPFLGLDTRIIWQNSDTSFTLSNTLSALKKISNAYKLNNAGLYSSTYAIDTSSNVGTGYDRLLIGRHAPASFFFNGSISKIYYYPQRLTQSQMIAFAK